MNSNGDR